MKISNIEAKKDLNTIPMVARHHHQPHASPRGLFKSWRPHFKGNDGFLNIS
jgi:hypothetical protein